MKGESKAFLAKIEPVRRRLQAWRRIRKPRERIPESLWEGMTQLGRAFGVSRVCRVLGVEYYPLKERVHGTNKSGGGRNGHAAFIELPVPPPPPTSECLVELEDGLGARMTLRLGGCAGTEVLSLVQAFWRRQP